MTEQKSKINSLRLYNIEETINILEISRTKFYTLRQTPEYKNLNLTSKYFTLDEIERIKQLIVFGYSGEKSPSKK